MVVVAIRPRLAGRRIGRAWPIAIWPIGIRIGIRVGIRIRVRRWPYDEVVAIAILLLLLLLLLLLFQQIVLQLLVFLLQITNRLFLSGLFCCLAFTGHLIRQGIDAGDFSSGVRVAGCSRWRDDVNGCRLSRISRFLLAVVNLSGGVSPFVDLLGQCDAWENLAQYGDQDYGGQWIEFHGQPAQ